jgi:DNA-binding SARP family transcriptional activator
VGPPIEVICFGGPRVLCAGQQVWPRVAGGEVKPWEFLLYLACQPADGVSSEDAVAALWPEDEEAENAPHRFRQLRYRLRHMLLDVPGAPETDGICLDRRGILRLDPGLVRSDAQEFLELVRKARISAGVGAIPHLEGARALYMGDLLDGRDARRYTWLDERDDSGVTLREHFRRQFQQASTRLAELYADSGELDAALGVFGELTELDPGDERLWRALFRLHADRGDRLALVRAEQRMREALHELAAEMDEADNAQLEEPSAEILEEYQRLLASLGDSERQPAAV